MSGGWAVYRSALTAGPWTSYGVARVCSLFRFAKPVHLNSEGLRWLMIHTANCFGHRQGVL